jgi:hypothetical protein
MAECHPQRVHYAKGLCKSCYHGALTASNPEFHRQQLENCRRWTAAHKQQCRANSLRWRAKQDPAYVSGIQHASKLKLSYGMTPQQYDELLKLQGGVCAICQKKPTTRRLAVDHCHTTGRIRGLLCFRCNFGLSFFAENSETMKRGSLHLAGLLFPTKTPEERAAV